MKSKLPAELRAVVSEAVRIFGTVLQRELGPRKFRFIERMRAEMVKTRADTNASRFRRLQRMLKLLEQKNRTERHEIADAFTLMLELMNACENAYRSHRLEQKTPQESHVGAESVIYVLTAHPTESRSPQNIALFHQIQNILQEVFAGGRLSALDGELRHWLEIAWRASIMRRRSPKVRDEAEHIFSLLFRKEVFFSLIEKREFPFYVRTWVGGDKDGHPGVNEKTLLQSLTLSRAHLLRISVSLLREVHETLELISDRERAQGVTRLIARFRALSTLRTGDGVRAQRLRQDCRQIGEEYQKQFGEKHPALKRLGRVLHAFPGLVVPLELRESSDMLRSVEKRLPIYRMLKAVERISRGGNPRWYARGFIISMTMSTDDIRAAADLQKDVFRDLPLPIIPLFENAQALKDSRQIMSQTLRFPLIRRAARKNWGNMIEIMVGYSDSAKEGGALASRWAIASALPELEKICTRAGFKPIFFHGSGGSVDRGGGTIDDQTSWWPQTALRNYKVTIQGEMVERSLASAAIARRQIEKIGDNISLHLRRPQRLRPEPAVARFAEHASAHYRAKITDPRFLQLIERATPYTFLNALKIGSRPSKRAKQLTVQGLRAIPWVLCWTQTRVLFPTWWGIGSAWAEAATAERANIRRAFREQPVFTSYIKALGFTLSKIRLDVWRCYLKEFGEDQAHQEFQRELALTQKAFREITGQNDFLWYRPWLAESVALRSAMIHPLNLLQILAIRERDLGLLRVTVTGISSGMMTTG